MRRSPEAFLRARLLALYLLSLAAVSGSILAWHPHQARSPLFLLWPPLGLGAAALAGETLHDRLSSLLDRHARTRIRSVSGLAYGAVLLVVSLGLLSGVSGAATEGCSLLRGLQVVFLLLAGFGRGHLGTLINAFALTSTSVLAGGPGAAVSAALHGSLLVFFLTADHAARSLTEFPVDRMPAAGPLLFRGIAPAALLLALLSAFFALLPPAPYAPLQKAGAIATIPAGQLLGLLTNLGIVAILSTVAIYAVLRFGGGGKGGPAEEPPVEFAAARRETEKAGGARYIEPPVERKEWRARIVALYVKTAEQLAKWGRRRRPYQTAGEFARSLAPAGSAADLSELFGRARYGGEPMSEADFERASRLCGEILDHHRRRD
jgi:hypothetical protein